MKRGIEFWIAAISVVVTLFIGTMHAQTAALTPTPAQMTQLQLHQKDAIIASQKEQLIQQSMQAAQVEYQTALAALNTEAEKVKKENKWADTVTFDPNQLTFIAPPPAPAKPATPPAEPKK